MSSWKQAIVMILMRWSKTCSLALVKRPAKGTGRPKGHVALSQLGAVGGKPTREHHIRVRSQRSERLQFQASGPPRQHMRRTCSIDPRALVGEGQRQKAPTG